jgi:hypothetical protein
MHVLIFMLSIEIQFNIHKISSSFFCSWQRLKIPGSPLHLAYHHSSGCSVIVCTVSSGCRIRQKKHMDPSHTSVSCNNFPLHPLNGRSKHQKFCDLFQDGSLSWLLLVHAVSMCQVQHRTILFLIMG